MNNHKFLNIPGAEIKVLTEESTLKDLEQGTITGFPFTTKRQHAVDPVQVSQIKYTPFKQNQNLKISAVVRSGGKIYDTDILFDDVVFEDEDAETNITFTGSDNEQYHAQPISLKDHEVKVKCSCLDFHYRFAIWNFNDDSLYGNPPPPYRRKTTTRPPVNPTQTPGVCKHILKLMKALQRSQLVVN